MEMRLSSVFIFKRMDYCKYNAIDIFHHIVIPKADHSIAKRFQIFCSLLIILFLLQMLTSIQFNDEFRFWRTEVRDEIANRMLPAESDSQLVIPYS